MQINDLPYQFRYAQYQLGLYSLYAPTETELSLLSDAVKRAWELFSEELNNPLHAPVAGLFCYDMDRCSGKFNTADAICCPSPDGHYIGVSQQAVERGGEYVQFLLIHELVHALTDTVHTPHYEATLDEMLMRYNARFGTNLKNDYATFNDESEVLN